MKTRSRLVLMIVALNMLFFFSYAGIVFADDAEQTGSAESGTGVFYRPAWSSDQPVLTDTQNRTFVQGLKRFNLPGPPVPDVAVSQAPAVIRETPPPDENAPMVPGTLVIKKNTTIPTTVVSSGARSHVLEPSVANDGKYVLYTANWFAARSVDNGTTWTYVNPYADFPTFCCDQDVIYDPARRALIWYRQGIANASGVNSIKISVSTNGGTTFTTFTYSPTNINAAWTNQWLDYPHIALSNDYLYIASNMFNASDAYQRSVMLRLPLDALVANTPFTIDYSESNGGTFTPVQGATQNMYWAQHVSNTSMKIYKWPENSIAVTSTTVTIPAWTTGALTCTTTDGYNPCGRSDNRILSGWRSDWDTLPGEKVLGFFWNVKADGVTFKKAYTNAAVFRERDRTYVARPYIYSTVTNYIYANGAPNARGDLGISVTGVSTYPHYYVGVNDDFNASSSWSVALAATGLKGPSDNKWGDYSRVRPHYPAALNWVGTGWVLDAAGVSQPKFVIFGRDRETNSHNRWVSY